MAEVEALEQSRVSLVAEHEKLVKLNCDVEEVVSKLQSTLKSADKQFTKLEGKVKDLRKSGKTAEKDEDANSLMSVVENYSTIKNEVEGFIPKPGSWLCNWVVGNVNVIMRNRERILYRKEYEQFKEKASILGLFITSAVLLFGRYGWIDILYQLLLVYYFFTVTMREHILKSNGSNLKPWWIRHHYLSIAISISVLVWDKRSPTYEEFRVRFFAYAFYQNLVQILQTRYQLSRLYPLRVLGRATQMDTAWGEQPSHFSKSGLFVLLPFVYVGHALQFYIAVKLLEMGYVSEERELWMLSALFMTTCLGNVYTTTYIVLAKYGWISRRK